MPLAASDFSETPPAFRVKRLVSTASTNEDLKTMAAEGAADGTVIWALRQTAGKGRLGRTWESPPGNLYFSLLLRPRVQPEQFAQYTFVFALAVCKTLGAFVDAKRIGIKWPNDVLLDGKKICGLLLEADLAAPNPWLIIGCGLNVKHAPEQTSYPATALSAATDTELDLDDLMHALLSDFHAWRQTYEGQGFGPVRQAWLNQCAHLGQTVTVTAGGQPQTGIAQDLDEQGRLVLELQSGAILRMSAGDVFFG